MKIVNATCYLTEDLESLFSLIEHATKQARDWYTNTSVVERSAVSFSYWPLDREAPKTLRVGYYTTEAKPGGYDWCGYAKLRQTRSSCPRLGIFKKGKLPRSPLHALATAALDYNIVPAVATKDIARCFATLIGAASIMAYPETRQFFAFVEGFKLRYRERAKRGSRKAIKRVREEIKLVDLQKASICARARIETLASELHWAREKHHEALSELRRQEEVLREF